MTENAPMEKFWSHFFEIYEAIPRQGPGGRESTERALHMLPSLTPNQRILDIGCGSGTQTIDLARTTAAQILAVDSHEAFVAELVKRIADHGLASRIHTQVGDMNNLAFSDESFDVIWCEGAIVIITGHFSKGIASWRRLLRPGGHMVVSELCWLRDDPPTEVKTFFDAEGADVTDADTRRKDILANGYQLVGDFVLPAVGWWENYYVPLAESLRRFKAKHVGDPEALAVAQRSQFEIDIYRKYPEHFGYVFFVMKLEERFVKSTDR